MAHLSIQPKDEDKYFAGDSLDIPWSFTDEHDDSAIDLSDKTVEFRVKSDLTDLDADAFLVKSSDEIDINGNPEIEITDPATGSCVIHVIRGDTEGAVDSGAGNRLDSVTMWVHIRVLKDPDQQVTADTAEWEIWAA